MSSVSRIQRSLTLEEFLALPEEEPSLEFIEGAGLSRAAAVIDVGGGTSKLVDDLLDSG